MPAGSAPGNTHAARTAYAEVNALMAIGRGQLPQNPFMQSTMPVNTNVNLTCNAAWDGIALNLYRSGSGCANTGELPGVIAHEWNHALDQFDANGTISSPSEGIAHAYSALRFNQSCIARGFTTSNCDGYGDACTQCTGIDDIDFAKHASGNPHGLTFASATCPALGTRGPCNREVHCEGIIVGEALWDLWRRDLVTAPDNLPPRVAHELAAALIHRASGAVTNWYQCVAGSSGCPATSGYLNLLAADDDNGNLLDGTPHMAAIFRAFNRHGIACPTPTVTNTGCPGAPATMSAVSTTPLDSAVGLSWTPVENAVAYKIFRGDPINSCAFARELIGTTTETSFLDTGLRNGQDHGYLVVPVGANPQCMVASSDCIIAGGVAFARPTLDAANAAVEFVQGDGDAFVDNCEVADYKLPFVNVSGGNATNVRILGMTSPSHPEVEIISPFPLPVGSIQLVCANLDARVRFRPRGLVRGDALTFVITYTSDEMFGLVQQATVSVDTTELDLMPFASVTADFDHGLGDWRVARGTFVTSSLDGGGANGTTGYARSSIALDNQCDVVQSPLLKLNANTTLTMFTRYAIEGNSGGEFYDRANVALRRRGSDTAIAVEPSSGRLYTATGPGPFGALSCPIEGERGWAGTAASFASSSWSAAALDAGSFGNDLVRLEVRYGTDGAVSLNGFRFDQVTLTNVSLAVEDAQVNICGGLGDPIFANGFE